MVRQVSGPTPSYQKQDGCAVHTVMQLIHLTIALTLEMTMTGMAVIVTVNAALKWRSSEVCLTSSIYLW